MTVSRPGNGRAYPYSIYSGVRHLIVPRFYPFFGFSLASGFIVDIGYVFRKMVAGCSYMKPMFRVWKAHPYMHMQNTSSQARPADSFSVYLWTNKSIPCVSCVP